MNNDAITLETYVDDGDELILKFEGGSVSIDFGDETPIETYNDEVSHVYISGGDYEITVTPLTIIPVFEFNAQELVTWGTDLVKRYIFRHDYPMFPNYLAPWMTDLSYMFHYHSEDGAGINPYSLVDWDTSNVTNMKSMFENRPGFSGTDYGSGLDYIKNWDVSNVTNMSGMFKRCRSLNSDLSNWDTSNVTDMSYMFYQCYLESSFTEWNTAKVTDMSYMFYDSNSFNKDLSQWTVSSVTDMNHMFYQCYDFQCDLSNWDTSNVTDMSYMFTSCYKLFDVDSLNRSVSLENWDTGNVTNMSHMFYQCFSGVSFNIARWDTSNVTDMSYVFYQCYNMNHPTHWDVSKVTNMEGMFEGYFSFNSDLSGWDVSNVTNMDRMFYGCTWFISSLENWNVSHILSEPTDFLTGPWGDTNDIFQPPINMPRWGQPASKP